MQFIGPFIVASPTSPRRHFLFERDNAKIAPNHDKVGEGLGHATVKHYGAAGDRIDELI